MSAVKGAPGSTKMNDGKTLYNIIYADPPWYYYGSPHKDQAAGKHYNLLKTEEIANLDVPSIIDGKAVLLLWSTSSKIKDAIYVMEAWGFHYRGVHHVWVKTRKDGTPISGQGIRPSFIKPTAEYLLIGSTTKRGRTLPICSESLPNVVLAPRPNRHSEKPDVFRELIDRLFCDRSLKRIELFARKKVPGWDVWGDEVESDVEIVWR